MRPVPMASWKRVTATICAGLILDNVLALHIVRRPLLIGFYSACQYVGLLAKIDRWEDAGSTFGGYTVMPFPPTTGTMLIDMVFLFVWPSLAILLSLLVYHRLSLYDRSIPRCARCSYSLVGLTAPRCPECGLAI